MEEEQNLTSKRGGKREGAGRPKGAVQKAPKKPKKEYVCNFHVRCTSLRQKELLEEFWKTIKNL